MIDDGIAVHYNDLAKGTPVYGSDEVEVGRVVRVSDNAREGILDGIIFEDAKGEVRFVDAPEVGRTAEHAVTLTITAGEAAKLGPPRGGPLDAVRNGRLGRLFGA